MLPPRSYQTRPVPEEEGWSYIGLAMVRKRTGTRLVCPVRVKDAGLMASGRVRANVWNTMVRTIPSAPERAGGWALAGQTDAPEHIYKTLETWL